MKLMKPLSILVACLALVACTTTPKPMTEAELDAFEKKVTAGDDTLSTHVVAQNLPMTQPRIDPKVPPAPPKLRNVKVISAFDVEDYTYMLADEGGKHIWVAVPQADVKSGDTLEMSQGTLMPDFYSKTLNKTFPEIYFITHIKVLTRAKPEEQTSIDTRAASDVSLAALVEGKDTYKGTKVRFKAKVTKVTPNIMGRSWVHVTDPSPDAKPIDLVVTTTDATGAGEIVTVEGVLILNRDFGSGYFFPMIIESARVVK